MLDFASCQQARLSRDHRFDGRFFIAVNTTKIYCRPICPATPPLEKNVRYFVTAIEAAQAGYRPCLRCRPDSAPASAAWHGVDATLDRAISLIEQGALENGSLVELSARLGIGERYLRQLFQQHLGVSPKSYALYQQCLFAKKLLHETTLPITQIALASGFNSVRRFNDCFLKQLQLSPSALRQQRGKAANSFTVKLSYRPPYDWEGMLGFLKKRMISSLEWGDQKTYGRTFEYGDAKGFFTVENNSQQCCLNVSLSVDRPETIKGVIVNIRRLFDTDANSEHIEQCIEKATKGRLFLQSGLRLPGTWSLFEAGVRAILGQQVSVAAAHKLVATLVEQLGATIILPNWNEQKLFPTPEYLIKSDLSFFKMPGSRKQTLKNLAQYLLDHQDCHEPDRWLALKGIGPWTIAYAKMRGLSDPAIFLRGDAGVNNAIKALHQNNHDIDTEKMIAEAAPWGSYLTLHLWNQK